MSMNRVDSKDLRTLIRRLAVLERERLHQFEVAGLPPGVSDLRRSVTMLDDILEALDDYEAALPTQIISTRTAQKDFLV